MAKGPRVTDGVRYLITSVHEKHSKWKAWEVRTEVSLLLHKNNPNLPPNWPSLSIVQKVLAYFDNEKKKLPPDPRGQLWHLNSLSDYDLPAEAVPLLLQIQKSRKDNGLLPLTIRQAWWASRLRSVVTDARSLDYWACIYADYESFHRTTGLQLNSSDLDETIEEIPRNLNEESEVALRKAMFLLTDSKLDAINKRKKNQGEAQNERAHSQKVQ